MILKTKTEDIAILKRRHSSMLPSQWFYFIDGRPECGGIAALQYLKSVGFTTAEAGQYMRELQGPAEPIRMDPSEERHFA